LANYAILFAHEGGYVANNNHAEAEVNGEGRCAFYFISATNGTMILFAHDFLRLGPRSNIRSRACLRQMIFLSLMDWRILLVSNVSVTV
jgi:hypothetical protein